ncbi:hypothetical protein [Desulfobacter sp.]
MQHNFGHYPDAVFCKFCSERLNPPSGKKNLIGPEEPPDKHLGPWKQ